MRSISLSGILVLAAMGVARVEDLIVWQLASAFKREVYRLVRHSGEANRDLRYRGQLFDAASSTEANVIEGFHRNRPKEFAQFLRYARASHAEAEARLKDGIARGYFSSEQCKEALLLAKRCSMALLRLLQSLTPFL